AFHTLGDFRVDGDGAFGVAGVGDQIALGGTGVFLRDIGDGGGVVFHRLLAYGVDDLVAVFITGRQIIPGVGPLVSFGEFDLFFLFPIGIQVDSDRVMGEICSLFILPFFGDLDADSTGVGKGVVACDCRIINVHSVIVIPAQR